MFKKIVFASLIVLSLFFGCTSREEQASAESVAPNFTLQDMDGNSVSLSQFKGKVVILDFWATWCPPCRKAIPGLKRLYKTYNAQGLMVLGISMDQGSWDSVKEFQTGYGVTYPFLKGNDEVAVKYMVRGIPMLIITDRQGKVYKRHVGATNEADIEREVKTLL